MLTTFFVRPRLCKWINDLGNLLVTYALHVLCIHMNIMLFATDHIIVLVKMNH